MKTYAGVKAEIVKLEQTAEKLRKEEVSAVVTQIREQIRTYGLTAKDLGLGSFSGQRKGSGTKSVGVPKYRDPKTGKTWTGHGKPPGWIAGAKNREAFLIDAPTSAVQATASVASPPTGEGTSVVKKRAARKAAVPKKAAPRKTAAKKVAAKKAAD